MSRLVALIALAALLALTLAPAAHADSDSTPYPGIRLLRRSVEGPNQVYIVVVDLCTPGIGFRATKVEEHPARTSTWAQSVGVEVAVNADFFNLETFSTYGPAIGGGEEWPNSVDLPGTGYVAFGADFATIKLPQDPNGPLPPQADDLASGLDGMLHRGTRVNLTDCTGSECQRHPRTAVGMTPDRRTMFLVVVDGRQNDSIGMTQSELADIFEDLGATDAYTFDGGGSSTLFIANEGGVVNDFSDASERTVGSHLGIHAEGLAAGRPVSCQEQPIDELTFNAHALDGLASSDVDGDGKADTCARAGGGFECHLAAGGEPLRIPDLANDRGFSDPVRFGSIRMADVTGDGNADVCARDDAGIVCWASTGTGFGAAVRGPALSDGAGWAAPQHNTTLRFVDVTGDGKADLCARASTGLQCWPAADTGFAEAPFELAALSDGAGFASPARYGTIRMGDVDGDRKVDVCARFADGMQCFLATGSGFGPAVTGPAWSDGAGFAAQKHWSTIRLVDVTGDGNADLCARAAGGMECAPATADGFGALVGGGPFSDADGFDDQGNYLTLLMGDVTGDGKADVCARGDGGVSCFAATEGGAFGAQLQGPALSDDASFHQPRLYRTLRMADVDGDGTNDVCVRAPDGVRCFASDGTSLTTEIVGPAFSDANGWAPDQHATTLRIATPTAAGRGAEGEGEANEGEGEGSEGEGEGEGAEGEGEGAAFPPVLRDGCNASRSSAPGLVLALLGFATVLVRRRRR